MLITFLGACSNGQDDSPEARWKRAYDAGLAAQEAGDLTKAKQNLRESIAALSDDKPSKKWARSALCLAGILLEEHDCAGALASAQAAMSVFESQWDPLKASSSLDESGPDFLNAMLTKARSLNCLGRYSEALPLLQRTYSLQAKVIVPVKFNHELTDALRVALSGTGNRQAAQKLHDEIRSTESSLPEADWQDVSNWSYEEALKEGKSAQEGGNSRAAEKLLKHAVQAAKKGEGDALKESEAMLYLGDVYAARANYTEARPLLERALSLARAHLDKHDRRLKEYLKRLASFYANNSQWDKAAALDEEALSLIFADEYRLDKHMHRSRDLMSALIDIYRKSGHLDKAEKMARRKLDLETQGYGKDSRKVGATAGQLAKILLLQKNDKEAEKYYEISFTTLKNNKKTDPRELEKSASEYSEFLEGRGERARAQKVRAEARALNEELLDGLSIRSAR